MIRAFQRAQRVTRSVRRCSAKARSAPSRQVPERSIDPIVVILGAGFVGVGAYSIHFALDFPEPCQRSVEFAEAHPAVKDQLGVPVRTSMLWTGTVGEETAFMVLPITGANGTRAQLFSRAVLMEDGAWRPVRLELEIDSRRFNLLTEANPLAEIKPTSDAQSVAAAQVHGEMKKQMTADATSE